MMSATLNPYNLKDAERCFVAAFNKWITKHGYEDNFSCFYTLPPNKDKYDDFVGATYKILYYYPTGDACVCCYVFFRLTRATLLCQPELSSIEVYSADPYKSVWKRHLKSYTNPIGAIIEAIYACFNTVPDASLPVEYAHSLTKPARDACVKINETVKGGIDIETV